MSYCCSGAQMTLSPMSSWVICQSATLNRPLRLSFLTTGSLKPGHSCCSSVLLACRKHEIARQLVANKRQCVWRCKQTKTENSPQRISSLQRKFKNLNRQKNAPDGSPSLALLHVSVPPPGRRSLSRQTKRRYIFAPHSHSMLTTKSPLCSNNLTETHQAPVSRPFLCAFLYLQCQGQAQQKLYLCHRHLHRDTVIPSSRRLYSHLFPNCSPALTHRDEIKCNAIGISP